ncbi:MAG TPA: hypothetical protein VJK05_05055 [archaeon]|nr:hypothetical protein [archaeon]
MPNITIAVTEEIRKKMNEHPEIKWSNAVRAIIERKLADFKEAERLAKKSILTEEDVEKLSAKAASNAARKAKRLLNESNY